MVSLEVFPVYEAFDALLDHIDIRLEPVSELLDSLCKEVLVGKFLALPKGQC